jgi:hypothetical protein
MAQKKFPLIDGWEIGWSKDVLVACLERGGDITGSDFNVGMSSTAEEAAQYLEQEIDVIDDHWNGNDRDLEFIHNFIKRFHPALNN